MNINAFYAVDTIVQLPLARTGDEKHFSVFKGRVLNPFPQPTSRSDDPRKKLPAFSDMLLKSGENK